MIDHKKQKKFLCSWAHIHLQINSFLIIIVPDLNSWLEIKVEMISRFQPLFTIVSGCWVISSQAWSVGVSTVWNSSRIPRVDKISFCLIHFGLIHDTNINKSVASVDLIDMDFQYNIRCNWLIVNCSEVIKWSVNLFSWELNSFLSFLDFQVGMMAELIDV